MNSRIVARCGWRPDFNVTGVAVRAVTVVALVVSLFGVFPASQPASAFSEPGANALLTVVKHVDNQEDARGDGSALNVCEVELRADRLVSGAPEEVTSFPGAEPDVCVGDPQATTGTTAVGIDVDIDRGSPTETFMISEPALDGRYLATFSGDCDLAGRVVLAPGDDKTCVVTNTLLNDESMADSNALLTVVTHVDNGDVVDGSELTICDFGIALTSLVSGAQVAEFPAEQGFACGQPNLLVGTTQLGVEVDNASHDISQPGRFIISEPLLDPRYVVTFGGDCVGGDVSIRRGEHLTCVITNTLVDGFQEPGANAILTVVKQLDNQEDIVGDGSALGLCEVEIRVGRFDGSEVDRFPAGAGTACSDPLTTSGSTDLGINVDTERTSPSETFIVSEPTLVDGYLATFAGDCDLAGRVELEAGQRKTCVVTNTLLNAASMADANALLTVIKVVDNDANPAGVGLNVCDFQIEVALRNTGQSVGTFAAESGLVCSQPDLVDGTTHLGVAINTDPRDGPVTSTFVISEPGLDVRYAASFSADCAGGEVTLRAGEVRTCVITNTLVDSPPPVNRAPVANDDAYVTDEDTLLSVAAVDGLLANDTDADGDTLAAIDVSEPVHGDVTVSADGGFSYSPDAGFNGTDTFTYRAIDGSLTSEVATVTITVNAVDDLPVVTVDDPIVEVDEGQVATNSGTVSDADGDAVVLSASVGVVVNNGDGTWSWSFATIDGPAESQMVTVNQTAFELAVANVAPSATIVGAPATSDEGTPISLTSSVIDAGVVDTHSLAWKVSRDGVLYATGTGDAFSFVPDDDGSYLVTLTATDKDGAAGDDTALVTVQNVAPSVGPITAPVDPILINGAISASAGFSDAGTADTHTATFDWGDGTSSPGTIDETNGSGSASGSHAYGEPGVYTIVLTVTDDDGGSATSTYQYVVVYDPNGGFVTGGGWITSPAGAYLADPTLSGKASFGFVAKYKKGQSIPDGNTQFQFHAAGMSFQSTSYEWLVIAGANARFKGTGTINGAGNYGFMLTSVDGQASGGGGSDRFRIKIWDLASGETVYDNQPGAGDDVALTTMLGGGSIVIHKK